jgi:uncharacterized protein YndB with AHSA1/START domain
MATKPFTLELWIDAKPEAVFDVLADLDLAKQWHPSILSIQPLTGGPMKEGSTWIETRPMRGKPQASTIKVTRFERPAKGPGAFAIHVDHKVVDMDCTFVLLPKEDGTRIEYTAIGRGKGLMKLFAGKINKEMEKVDADLLPRLCHVVTECVKEGKVGKAKPAATKAPAKAAKGKAKTAK